LCGKFDPGKRFSGSEGEKLNSNESTKRGSIARGVLPEKERVLWEVGGEKGRKRNKGARKVGLNHWRKVIGQEPGGPRWEWGLREDPRSRRGGFLKGGKVDG